MGDIDERKRRELAAVEDLAHQANHDALTGQPNRAFLATALPALLEQAHAGGTAVSLLFLDLDEFKVVNDAAGHLVGDAILVEVARRLAGAVREQDTLVRFGGDEFVVLCPDTAVADAVLLADRLHAELRPVFEVAGSRFFPAMSVGVAHEPAGRCAPTSTLWETLVQQADTAMYDAKRRGRNRTRVFDAVMAEQVRDLLELTTDLRAALETDALELWYQPVFHLASGALMGVEALARWNHPTRGMVPPAVFIAAAERSGLITVLDEWAMRRACVDAVRLREAGVLDGEGRMAVNVSAKSVADGVLAAMVERGVPLEVRDRLVLEVTETGVMHDPERAEADLTALHATGVRFSIDDFGTGQSSLIYLRRFPVAVLKVDASFVAGMVGSPEDRAIVRSVVSLALETGLTVVAEGIETPEQLLLLQDMGCTAGQGYHWTAALPVPDLVAWSQGR
jgi:diguanylate cyclase (GGDEF)-like protein